MKTAVKDTRYILRTRTLLGLPEDVRPQAVLKCSLGLRSYSHVGECLLGVTCLEIHGCGANCFLSLGSRRPGSRARCEQLRPVTTRLSVPSLDCRFVVPFQVLMQRRGSPRGFRQHRGAPDFPVPYERREINKNEDGRFSFLFFNALS